MFSHRVTGLVRIELVQNNFEKNQVGDNEKIFHEWHYSAEGKCVIGIQHLVDD